jgi:hypothetical protein
MTTLKPYQPARFATTLEDIYEFFKISVQYSMNWRMMDKIRRRLYNRKKLMLHIFLQYGKNFLFWKIAINV